jgi:hypothetical protein
MTEDQWLACDDPTPMLEYLRGKATERKLRLFAVATARSVWDMFEREDMRQAVEAGERHADGLMTEEDLRPHATAMYGYLTNPTPETREWFPGIGRGSREKLGVLKLALCSVFTRKGLAILSTHAYRDGLVLTNQYQPPLLRDLFGNPFHPVSAEPSWLTSTVLQLAASIYADRAFDRLPILADALQDVGCDRADMLDHCRGPGPHVRGCWVVDLVLGKE